MEEITEKNPQPTSPTPALGGIIHFQARLVDLIIWIGPAWASVCGVIAAGAFSWRGVDLLRLALLILLVDGGWGTLWTALGDTDWATPLQRWREWHTGAPIQTLPYTQPNTPSHLIAHWGGELISWWRAVLWPTCGRAISAITIALPLSVLLALLLGRDLLLLSLTALAVMQMGLAWEGGQGNVAPGWDGVISLTLPWMAGHAAFDALSLRSAVIAGLFTLVWSGAWRSSSRRGRIMNVGGYLLITTALVMLQRPLAVGMLALIIVPQVTLLPWLRRDQSPRWYVRHTRPWLMTAMLIAAWAL